MVAIADNGVIGHRGMLPWQGKLPADMKRFQEQTRGKAVVMGHGTFESIPKRFRPLPDRENLVLTKSKVLLGLRDFEPGYQMVTWEEVVERSKNEDLFVIGGAEIYKLALPLAEELYVTLVHTNPEGDTFFPSWDKDEWGLVFSDFHPADDRNEYDFTFQVYKRLH